MKKQGRRDRMDESLGMRNGRESMKRQSYPSRRHESMGMEQMEKYSGGHKGTQMGYNGSYGSDNGVRMKNHGDAGEYAEVKPIDYKNPTSKGYPPLAWHYKY